jgi:hypothetical protein
MAKRLCLSDLNRMHADNPLGLGRCQCQRLALKRESNSVPGEAPSASSFIGDLPGFQHLEPKGVFALMAANHMLCLPISLRSIFSHQGRGSVRGPLFVYEVHSVPFRAQLRSAAPRPPPVRDYAILHRSLGRRHQHLKPAHLRRKKESDEPPPLHRRNPSRYDISQFNNFRSNVLIGRFCIATLVPVPNIQVLAVMSRRQKPRILVPTKSCSCDDPSSH